MAGLKSRPIGSKRAEGESLSSLTFKQYLVELSRVTHGGIADVKTVAADSVAASATDPDI